MAHTQATDLDDDGADLAALRAELANLRQFKHDVIKLASHDLRSPLALVIGYSSLVTFDLPEDSPLQDYMRSVLQATERMIGLINAITTLEALHILPIIPDVGVNLYDAASMVTEDLRAMAADRRQTLLLIGSPDMPLLTVNRSLIKDAITQLIMNAVQYAEADRQVEVVVEPIADADGVPMRVALTVRDQGWGIAPEQQQHIFEVFFRGKQPSGTRNDGRGIGLWIVKMVVERHGGGVQVHSVVGEGSQIGFWLPVS
ncbi:MAG: HAMP domain-containing sensor histidine kinase [Chloroflexota bacterium]|nr:HAMP domain-containing sensor histidine kinase [Chloroflexota bacterium]